MANDPRLEIPEVLRGDGPPGAPKLTPPPASTPMSGASMAYAIAVEFVVYILVCAAIGYLIDRFVIGPSPSGHVGVTFTIVGGGLGMVGAVIRLMKAAKAMNSRP